MTYIFIKTIPGVKDIGLNIDDPQATTISQVISLVHNRLPSAVAKATYVSMQNGSIITQDHNKTLAELFPENPDYLLLRLNACLCGGKGGFGTMLKSQGKKKGKRRPRREEDNDSFRTLDGRMMKSIRQAKELLGHLEKLPERERERVEKKRAKLQAIIDSSNRVTSSGSSSTSKFTDTEYLETSESLIADVRKAVLNGGIRLEENNPEVSEVSDGEDSSSMSVKSSSSSHTDGEAVDDVAIGKGKENVSFTPKAANVNVTAISAATSVHSRPKALNFFGEEEFGDESD